MWASNNGWPGFLRGEARKEYYESWVDAKAACQQLAIKTSKEYALRYRIDSKLPANPAQMYSDVWKSHHSWSGFLGKIVCYKLYSDASKVVKKLGITSRRDYSKKRKLDPQLPSNPPAKYAKEWAKLGGWYGFLGLDKPYMTWRQAHLAAKKLNCKSRSEYRTRCRSDPALPARPDVVFSDVWEEKGSWRGYLGLPSWYKTLNEASAAAKKLNINSRLNYKKLHAADSKLHPNPDMFYSKDWGSVGQWEGFLGLALPYCTWNEAHQAAKPFNFQSAADYSRNRRVDSRLPANPKSRFRNVWKSNGGWEGFLGLPPPVDFCGTWEEASRIAVSNHVKTRQQYLKLTGEIKSLPRSPETVYKDVWRKNGGWFAFLKITKCYETWELTHEAVVKLRIKSPKEYKNARKFDSRLPATPHILFSAEWEQRGGWNGLLLPLRCKCLADVKHAVKILGIKDSSDYRKLNVLYDQLPSHPERKFKHEWVSWYELCDIPIPYEYEKARSIVLERNIKTISAYKQFTIDHPDPQLPKCPDLVYRSVWVNWHVFLRNREPYNLGSIRAPFEEWRHSIAEFMKIARGGADKTNSLCRFVREFIIKNNLGNSPVDFLTSNQSLLKEYREFIGIQGDSKKKKIIIHVNEFLDYVLARKMASEDEKSGFLIIKNNAKNPLKNIVWNFPSYSSNSHESNKPALAYLYVKTLKYWIFPEGATSYSDLTHLHKFNADWIEVDKNCIDKNDNDCVYKVENNKYKVWFPVYWTHLYSVVNTAARGRQVAYNDSGEADKQIPIFKNGAVSWIENPSSLKGGTNDQGFIMKLDGSKIGMRFTTNKSLSFQGYSVPWMPIEMAFWIIKLREWQAKYNPIKKPERWINLRGTNLNDIQKKRKGANCFLFRDYKTGSPGNFSGRLATRLAAALYHSQPDDISLARCDGPKSSLTSYSSKYTPHSLRTSLITSFLFEFGLPPEWVMKIVGHKTVVMTMHYGKPSQGEFLKVFDKGEKKALKESAYAKQRMIEQNRIDEIKSELISSSKDGLACLSNFTPSGNYLFRDYGFCPNAGTRCDDGGDFNEGQRNWLPVQNGYLGTQNCVRCRHFITGPAFIGGLLSLCNQLFFASKSQAEIHSKIDKSIRETSELIKNEEDKEYDSLKENIPFDVSIKNNLNLKKRKLSSEQERCAKKLDMYLCDLNGGYNLLNRCMELANSVHENFDGLKLVASPNRDAELSIDEVSHFRQLSELCEDAEIYELSENDSAIFSRTQLLDQLALNNKIEPKLFTLTKEEQLSVGNHMTSLLLKRLKSWDSLDSLINGNMLLDDPHVSNKISKSELFSSINTLCLKSTGD